MPGPNFRFPANLYYPFKDGGGLLIHYEPIGVVRTPFASIENMPIQPAAARGVKGCIELKPEFEEGCKDLDGFSHIIALYHFHRTGAYALSITPFLDTAAHGVFATRAPSRPNAIGISTLRLERIEGACLHVLDVDMLDNTPLLDIKPYVPHFESPSAVRIGWIEQAKKRISSQRSDKRFE